MKTFKLIFSIFALTLIAVACKSEASKSEKEVQTEEKVTSTAPFSLQKANNVINFTAYKTTEKVPVKGKFEKIEIINGGEGNSVKEAINGTEFSIPVSSIETEDESRNFKIQKFFFHVMKNTFTLKGKLQIATDSTGVAEFTMNEVTQKLPFNYTISNKVFTMNTTMDVNKWNAQNAVDSLNTACKDLHKGADGVSKTWSEVAINVTSTFE